MKIGFFDGSAGASGDMILGALVDSGFPLPELEKCVNSLNLHGVKLSKERVTRGHLTGCRVMVGIEEDHHHRRLHDIERMITGSHLPAAVKEKALKIFRRLAEAEAEVHGCSPEEIHFHEVGAKDAIVDIVGCCYGLEYLKIEKVYSSPLRVGFGEITCAHGRLPIPAPATLRLLKGAPIFSGDYEGEWVTPTGAAIISTLTGGWGGIPPMSLESVGYGAGASNRPYPNLLRLLIGSATEIMASGDEVELLETTIDDINPEFIPYLSEKLFEVPVLDLFISPVLMKKGRLGNQLSVLVDPALAVKALEIIFSETTTLGVRRSKVARTCLERENRVVKVQGEEIRVKVGKWNGKVIQYAPEFEDCRRVALATKLPLKVIYDQAKRVFDPSG